ncbi:metalloregulator ArsR/SmtB family transcription factor [Actinopolymorpha sp. B11F2]|uniref:helix-turn-helix transcriptional regulator n=1 Tax=Actinopolymorpha sp. B11F2 TaxID=3160862 RepID=UPI0032E39A91
MDTQRDVTPESAHQHGSTRERVARVILESGPQTAAALAERLGVTPAAIRRHLDAMLAEGVVVGRQQRVYGHRGRGRPAKVFALTDAGRGAFYQAYDDLAVSALRYIRETGGDHAVEEFARRMVGRLEERYRSVAASSPGAEGTSALAEALSEDGYAASVEPARLGEQLCQHHCPVAHVAEQFPQLCEAETEAFSRLLGRHVQRLATIAHGDGVCTTHVPHQPQEHRTQEHRTPEHRTHELRAAEPRTEQDRTQPTTRLDRTGRNSS